MRRFQKRLNKTNRYNYNSNIINQNGLETRDSYNPGMNGNQSNKSMFYWNIF